MLKQPLEILKLIRAALKSNWFSFYAIVLPVLVWPQIFDTFKSVADIFPGVDLKTSTEIIEDEFNEKFVLIEDQIKNMPDQSWVSKSEIGRIAREKTLDTILSKQIELKEALESEIESFIKMKDVEFSEWFSDVVHKSNTQISLMKAENFFNRKKCRVNTTRTIDAKEFMSGTPGFAEFGNVTERLFSVDNFIDVPTNWTQYDCEALATYYGEKLKTEKTELTISEHFKESSLTVKGSLICFSPEAAEEVIFGDCTRVDVQENGN